MPCEENVSQRCSGQQETVNKACWNKRLALKDDLPGKTPYKCFGIQSSHKIPLGFVIVCNTSKGFQCSLWSFGVFFLLSFSKTSDFKKALISIFLTTLNWQDFFILWYVSKKWFLPDCANKHLCARKFGVKNSLKLIQ